ncbi:9646_t:CDS:2, partial [Racocetra persica]
NSGVTMLLSPLSNRNHVIHNSEDKYDFENSPNDYILKDHDIVIEPDDIDLSSPRALAVITEQVVINVDLQPLPQSNHFLIDSLDEPVSKTILRDLRNIVIKLKQVLYPKGERDVLRDWDLWGPLILCLTLSTLLSIGAQSQEVTVFTSVFIIVWSGAAVVTINAKLLGSKV